MIQTHTYEFDTAEQFRSYFFWWLRKHSPDLKAEHTAGYAETGKWHLRYMEMLNTARICAVDITDIYLKIFPQNKKLFNGCI